jgi:hypothetical protein
MTPLDVIAAERRRQIEKEGFSPARDDAYDNGELLAAARCYIAGDGTRWPWAPSWWKPRDRRSNLIRAGALLQADLERLQRKAERTARHRAAIARALAGEEARVPSGPVFRPGVDPDALRVPREVLLRRVVVALDRIDNPEPVAGC